MDMRMRYDEEKAVWLAKLQGEIDMYETPHFKERVVKALSQHSGDIIFDCGELTYIDSTGLGALVAVFKQAQKHGHTLFVTQLKPQLFKIFRLTELDKLFSVEVAP